MIAAPTASVALREGAGTIGQGREIKGNRIGKEEVNWTYSHRTRLLV